MAMELDAVSSSMVQVIGYDKKARRLEVVFASGKAYFYEGVPPEEHAALMRAESKGKYMRAHIIGRYPCFELHYRGR
jgi:hypothetical protein